MDLASAKADIRRSLGILFVFSSGLFLIPFFAHAATMYISPAAKSVSVGQTFTLSAYVSSPDQSMNAASGDISFPSDKLQVLAVSKANSVMNLWIRDPSFTNSVAGGDVHFEGVVLNPGFIGTVGNLITITFQAVGTGAASVTFSSGAVLANDGNGTNILNSLSEGTVQISPRAAPATQPTTPPAQVATPSTTAELSSSTTAVATTTPPIVVGYISSSNKWKNAIMLTTEWGLVALLALLLGAAIVSLALLIVHKMRKWRVSSEHNLLVLEETLRNDLKRIEKELDSEKRSKTDSLRKTIEHMESEIKEK